MEGVKRKRFIVYFFWKIFVAPREPWNQSASLLFSNLLFLT